MLTELKRQVLEANLALARHDLVTLTWGNVSGIDRRKGLVVIKPSGVPYDTLGPDDMVVVDLDGRAAEGRHRPSSDLPTHLALYLAWPDIGGIAHAHSTHATMFAQACRPIPCLGTTHADYFHGPVPVTRSLTDREVAGDYESNTGDVIVERFAGTNPLHLPGVLVANHGPFTWGRNAGEAVQHAVVLEQVACLAMGTLRINAAAAPIAPYLLDKHFTRKHGPDAYYGQPAAKP